MGQLELANVLTEVWIIDHDVHGLADGPCDVEHLPTHYGEAVDPFVMTSGVGMVTDGTKSPEVFLEPFHIGPSRLSCILLITLQPVTVIHTDYSTFPCDVFPILGGH